MTTTERVAVDEPVEGLTRTPAPAPPPVDDRGGAAAAARDYSRIVDNIMSLSVGQVLGWIAATGLAIVLPRYLGDENLGRFTIAQSFTGLFGLFLSLGTAAYLTKEVARDRDVASGPVLNALVMRLPLAVVLGAIVFVVAFAVGYDSVTQLVILTFWVNTTLLSLYHVISGALQGLQDMRPAAFIFAVCSLIGLGLTLLGMRLGFGVVGIAATWNVSMTIVVVLVIRAIRRRGGLTGRVEIRSWRPLLAGGLPFLVWEVALYTYGRVDILMLSVLTNEAVIGWYGAAYRIASLPAVVPAILLAAAYPALAASARRDGERFRALCSGVLHAVFLGSIPLAAMIILLADRIVAAFGYPAEFDNSIVLVRILALHIPLVGADMVIGTALISLDRQRYWAIAGVAAAALNPAVNLVLIPLTQAEFGNGAIGASISTVATEIFMMIAGLWLLRGYALGPKSFKIGARCLAASLVMAATIWTLHDLSLPLVVAAGGAVYVAAAFALRAVSRADVLRTIDYAVNRRRYAAIDELTR